MKKSCGRILVALAFTWSAGLCLAQGYPTRPIHIITAGAGSGADVLVRVVTGEMSGPLGQAVVVENRVPGPAMAMAVARAPADGHTLLVWAGGLWLGPLLEPAPYEVFRDFSPVITLVRTPTVLVVPPSLPVKTVADLVALAKTRPGQLNYSSGSNGSTSHLAGELFKSMASVDIVRITYKGSPQETADLMSGQIQMTFGSGASLIAPLKSGKLRALASTGSARSLMFPDLPTVGDTLPGFVAEQLYALWAPAKTPEASIRRLNQETQRALENASVREKLINNGLEPVGGSPEQLVNLVKSELARMSKVIGNAKPGS